MKVLDAALPHIQRQRTELSSAPDVRAAYLLDVEEDVKQITPYLPEKCRTILGIGCGMAGVEIAVARERGAFLYMMDGSGMSPMQAGYHDHALDVWNDTEIALQQARANDVEATALTPDPQATVPCDLIVSLLSWCHHYPAGVYLTLATRSLRKGGRMIVDCRKETENKARLSERFKLIEALPMRGLNARKSERCIFER